MNPTTPSTDNKVDKDEPKASVSKTMDDLYNLAIDHCIGIIQSYKNVSEDIRTKYTLAEIISQLEQLKSK